jgi:hypothetical protein
MRKNAVAAALLVLLSQPASAQWVQTGGPQGAWVNVVCVGQSGMFAGTRGGGVFASTDGGAHWAAANSGIPEIMGTVVI